MKQDNQFFTFTRNCPFIAFQNWLRGMENVDNLLKLGTDKTGAQLYAIFYQREKRGLIKVHQDQVEVLQQKIINEVQFQFSRNHKVRVKVGRHGA